MDSLTSYTRAAAITVLALCYCFTMTRASAESFKDWAPTPPMGWNSWDIFGTTVTEQQVKEQADAMARHLLPAGYNVLTVDIQWYEPDAQGHVYRPGAPLEMDEYSRLIPAVKRFPSSANGEGFKPLADHIHSKGLKFGIHIMRGIPRQAADRNTPILGTDSRAGDVADRNSTCPWNPDMYGVDMSRPGAQAYYDSIFQMYADWGVDYVKVDDIARPYDAGQKAEIEAIRKAIDKTGRPIVLSLSPGATPIEAGGHVSSHANLWRITDDFWDRWGLLYAMFERVDTWTPYRKPGAWPDADMIPLGVIDFGRPTKLTPDEQQTLMTLWCIARSPLIFGGDMSRLDDATLKLLTNPEVLKVNQASTNNRQVYREKNLIVWAADVPGSDHKYVALFNAQSRGDELSFDAADFTSPVISGTGSTVPIEVDIQGAKRLVLFVRDGGDNFHFDHAVWTEPVLSGPKGEKKLTELKWTSATAGWGEARVNRTCEDQPLQADGIGTHANSTIIYELPQGYDTFKATGTLTHHGSIEFGVLVDRGGVISIPDTSTVSIDFADLGITGKAEVRDLWAGESLGEFEGSFGRELPLHGAGLYRVTPK